jgi:hypothetical protein
MYIITTLLFLKHSFVYLFRAALYMLILILWWGDNLPTDDSPTVQLTDRQLTDRAKENDNSPTATTYRQG